MRFLGIRSKYRSASKQLKTQLLDEFCSLCGYNRKYAIRLFQRLMESEQFNQEIKYELKKQFKKLNPFDLQKRMKEKIIKIIDKKTYNIINKNTI